MANTTNFGWETPDDTDLVKDGAAAIRTLGSAIDTSLVDLKGGTTDQVLAKNSNTDMDFKWVTSDDANAIQNSIIDAKADLIVGSAADTPARLAVGANGTVLTADSGETTGLKWAAPSGASYSGVSVKDPGPVSVATATWTIIGLSQEVFDVGGYHNNVTNNSRLTVPSGKAGYYQVNAAGTFTANATGKRAVAVYKNGTIHRIGPEVPGTASTQTGSSLSFVDYFAEGDYIQIAAYQNSGTNQDFRTGVDDCFIFDFNFIGA